MRQFLTTEEVSERYRGQISTGTLENWRTQRIGPPFVKIGRAVLYPRDELDAWNKRNLVTCANGKMEGRRRRRTVERPAEPRSFGGRHRLPARRDGQTQSAARSFSIEKHILVQLKNMCIGCVQVRSLKMAIRHQ